MRMTDAPLTGQTALVTGGGRGLGRTLAEQLAAAGASVAVLARTRDEVEAAARWLREVHGVLGVAVSADVTDARQVARAVAEAEAALGGLDLLVNNAGGLRSTGPMWEVDPDVWWQDMAVNLRGPFLAARAVLPGMIARGGGRIVNITSSLALRPFPLASAYGAAKTALVRLTETLAGELAGTGVRVFAVAPGVVHTALVDAAAADPWVGPHFRRLLAEGRVVPPERAAALVVALASGAADALSGRYLDIDDDLAELARRLPEAPDTHSLRLTP